MLKYKMAGNARECEDRNNHLKEVSFPLPVIYTMF